MKTEIRTYFKAQILLDSPSLKEHREAFEIGNLPATTIGDFYHIGIGDSSVTHNQHVVEETTSVSLTLFNRGGQDSSTTLDNLLETAHGVMARIVNQENVATESTIRSILYLGASPEGVEDDVNENTIKVTMGFEILQGFKL